MRGNVGPLVGVAPPVSFPVQGSGRSHPPQALRPASILKNPARSRVDTHPGPSPLADLPNEGSLISRSGAVRSTGGVRATGVSLRPTPPPGRAGRHRRSAWVVGLTLLVVVVAVSSATGPWTSFTSPASLSTGVTPVAPGTLVAPTPPLAAGDAALAPVTGSSGDAVSSKVVPHVVPLNLPGPHPTAWGPDGLPPGNPALLPPSLEPSTPCYALNPAPVPQTLLPTGCGAHDEPSLNFYSDLPGSGGNVSWNATLPVDGSPTQNQSDLYAAAWFGIVVSDPASWFGQCYVEIQFYPDFNWSTPTTSTYGDWSGAAVGWQVDPATGAVDTCYYSPLYVHGLSGDGYFGMSQGDSFQLRLLGWTGETGGEQAWINDTTSGAASHLTLYNSTADLPLDPAYSANDVQNALLWTPGGGLPNSFQLEIGRSGNPGGVTNSSFGGCTPGAKRSSPVDPSVPCPSYNPLSWVNDTLTPWNVGVPTFPNGPTNSTPSQFGLSSNLGGVAAIPVLSNGTCGSRIGSTDCTYPWFSYSCTSPGFTFGATDFASVTSDFGESNEYPAVATPNILGIPAYPTNNFSTPTCGSGGHTVTVSTQGPGSGSVYFLSGSYTSTSQVSGIPVGNYSISALESLGSGFTGWLTSGGVTVASASAPVTTLTVAGDGSVSAVFASGPTPSQVWFNSTLPGGLVVVTPGAQYSFNVPASTVLAGNSIELSPGVYGVQAGPPPGSTFSSWSTPQGAAGVSLASVDSPVTWLTVTGTTPTSSVEATYLTSSGSTRVNVSTNGFGRVSFNSVTVPYDPATGLFNATIAASPGTYAVVATPARGWEFYGWAYGAGSVLLGFNATTNVTVAPGVASLTATFAADVRSFNTPATGGRVAVNDVGPLPNGTISWLPRGTYDLDALPLGGQTFVDWSVNNTAALWVASLSSPVTELTVNTTGTVTALFVVGPPVNVTFDNAPATGGEIRFNYQYISGASTTNSTLTDGTYLLRAIPASGWVFGSWTFTSNLSLVSGNLVVKGGGGTVTAHFTRASYAVSFVAEESTIFVNASIGGHDLTSGDTIYLTPGKYVLIALPGTDTTFLKWVITGSMFVGNPLKGTTNLTVSGAGTLSAIADGFELTGVTATPIASEVGVGVRFTAEYAGSTPRTYAWSGLPTGCVSADVDSLSCTPTGSGSASVVATVAGANGIPVRSLPLLYDVNGSLVVASFSASHSDLDLGMSTTLTTGIAGGLSPYSYSYTGLPTGCSSENTSALLCTPTATGMWTAGVTVSDVLGVHATGNVGVTVFPALDVQGLSTNRGIVTATVPFDLNASVSGGATPLSYQYSGLPAGCTTVDAGNLTCTPGTSAAGNYTIEVTVTDSVGATGSASVTERVNAYPTISSFSATPDPLTLGANVTFTVVAGGGTGALTYAYTGLPLGCTSVNASTFQCQPVAVDLFEVIVTVSDVFGRSATETAVLNIEAPQTTSPNGAGSAGSNWWIWVVIAIVVVAAVVGLLYWWRTRTPPATPAPLNPPAPAPTSPPPTNWNEGGN
jgi:hypothetical protein